MYYLSRFSIRDNAYYIIDTEDNVEECINRYQLHQLLWAGVEIKGIEAKFSHSFTQGDKIKLTKIEPYVMPSGDSARLLLLHGFHCTLDENGFLIQIVPQKEGGTKDLVLSQICKGIAAHAFSPTCLKGSFTYIFDDSLSLDVNMFSRWCLEPRSNVILDIQALSDEKADVFYTALGVYVQDFDIIDNRRRKADNIGHQCYLNGISPNAPSSYIANRRIWPGEFDDLYVAVRKGIPVTTGWRKRVLHYATATRELALSHMENRIMEYEHSKTFYSGVTGSFTDVFNLIGGRLTMARKLSYYAKAGGNDPILLDAFYKWLKDSYAILHKQEWGD